MRFLEHRLDVILRRLEQDRRVSVPHLSGLLKVSQESIRRDLKELEARGHVRRVYGGAVLERKTSDQPFAERMKVNGREKMRIGEEAARFVRDGMKVFLDTGTTALSVLRHLSGRKDVTIVSNSVAVATQTLDLSGLTIRILGGCLRPEYQAVYGHETAEALKEHYFDLSIIGITAIHPERGFMDFGEEEALLRRLACKQSGSTIVLADSSKFGRLGSVHTLGFDQVDRIIAGPAVPAEFASAFRAANLEVTTTPGRAPQKAAGR
ncbi:MAG: DeoR/GlpR family DNA-binding transcription regulator [Rhizobiaceae bacterium]|nr:DeoR/GlpR family DNA-binding transcription regulator [Rhizobiaceae bacterium]